MPALRLLNRAVARLTALAAWLVLPVSLLLCLQWPLRDGLHQWSREANDLAQWLFALYVSVALSYATRRGTHLTPDALAQRYAPALRRGLLRAATLAVVLPFAAFVLYAAAPAAWQSLRQQEAFPDTFNPGYFVLKLSVCLLALLVALQALLDLFLPAVADQPAQGGHG